MAISGTYSRPKLNQTLLEGYSITIADGETAGTFVIDIIATVGSNPKLLNRIILTPNISGYNLSFGGQILTFPGTAADRSSVTVPANNASTGTASTFVTPTVDLDAFYTAAGDTRANS